MRQRAREAGLAVAVRSPLVVVQPIERCCPKGSCRYRPDQIEKFVRDVRAMRQAGLDITSNARSVLRPSRGFGGSDVRTPVHDYDEAEPALILSEIQQAMRSAQDAIRAVAAGLCPYAMEAAEPVEEPTSPLWLTFEQARERVGLSRAQFYVWLGRHEIRRRYLAGTGRASRSPLFHAADMERATSPVDEASANVGYYRRERMS